jgi:hypothetical protein
MIPFALNQILVSVAKVSRGIRMRREADRRLPESRAKFNTGLVPDGESESRDSCHFSSPFR